MTMDDRRAPALPEPPAELQVDRIATGGEGVARLDSGEVVFVQGALPGERVQVAITERKKRFARGEAVEIVEPSQHRIDPACTHARDGSCGGCDWMHATLAAQRELKTGIVIEQLQRLGGIEAPSVAHRDHASGQRTTVRCLVTNGRAGYRSRRQNVGFAAASCSAAHPLIEELIVDGRFVNADEVTIRVGAGTGDRLVVLHGANAQVDAIAVPDDVVVVTEDDCEGVHFHEEVAGRRWQISARSFFQTSQLGAEALVAAVADAAGETGSLVDLYAGVGLLGGAVGQDRLIAAVESSPSSVIDARSNLAEHTDVVRAKVERWSAINADTVIADPARRGLSKDGCATVHATNAARLVLVSCDPASMGRDTSLLAADGWQHQQSELVDMFPDSSRIEVVSVFER